MKKYNAENNGIDLQFFFHYENKIALKSDHKYIKNSLIKIIEER